MVRAYLRRFIMTFVITDACVGVKDGACVDICPVDCIHPRPDEPGFAEADQLYIDPVECIHCGICVDECPAKAIFSEDDVPLDKQQFIQINADWYIRN
jgi:ferredoxin